MPRIAFDSLQRSTPGHPKHYDDSVHAAVTSDIPVSHSAESGNQCHFVPMPMKDSASKSGYSLALAPLPAGESTRLFKLSGFQDDTLYLPSPVLNHDGSDNSPVISPRGKDVGAALLVGRSVEIENAAPDMVTVVANVGGIPSTKGSFDAPSPDISIQIPASFLSDGSVLNALSAERTDNSSGRTPGSDEDLNMNRGSSPYMQVRMLAEAASEHGVPYILKESEYAQWRMSDADYQRANAAPSQSHFKTTAGAWIDNAEGSRQVFSEETHRDSSGGQPSVFDRATKLILGEHSAFDKVQAAAKHQMDGDYDSPFSPDYAEDLESGPSLA